MSDYFEARSRDAERVERLLGSLNDASSYFVKSVASATGELDRLSEQIGDAKSQVAGPDQGYWTARKKDSARVETCLTTLSQANERFTRAAGVAVGELSRLTGEVADLERQAAAGRDRAREEAAEAERQTERRMEVQEALEAVLAKKSKAQTWINEMLRKLEASEAGGADHG